MSRRWCVLILAGALVASKASAQVEGAIAGRVTDARSGRPIAGALVEVDRGQYGAVADADGAFRVHEVRPGVHRLRVRAVGYRPLDRDSLVVTGGRTLLLAVTLAPEAIQLPGVVVEVEPDPLLNPQLTATVQPVSAAELRALPVTDLEEAVALTGGVVGRSVRGGRAGEDVLVLDGFSVKNHVDAASGPRGLAVPTVALEEAAMLTNGFSAQYGHALSGVLTAVTRDGGDRVEGIAFTETDRPLPDGWDYGFDRLVVALGGPLGIGDARFFAAVDAQARLDAEPVNAPRPTDPLDPRSERPWLLPHNAGERYDVFGKLRIPLGSRQTVRLAGATSSSQRLLFDPVLKYAPERGAGEHIRGRLAVAHLERVSRPDSAHTTVVDLRVGYFDREAIRAPLTHLPEFAFGAFSFGDYEFAGRDIARSRDTLGAEDGVPGFAWPGLESRSPWGVPAFFMTSSPRGELVWNRFREVRARLDVFWARGRSTDIRVGGAYALQRVETFSRVEAYRSTAAGGPPASAATFTPFQLAGYGEISQRLSDLTFSAGLRVDAFRSRAGLDAGDSPTRVALGPRFAVSTALPGATLVASYGRFAQAPDFQYLADLAFDDTLRTGRFRRGNPALGFETSTQYELQVRMRPALDLGIRVGVYVKRLDDLVASVPLGVDPDSAIFGNADFGDVRGVELSLTRDFTGGFGARVTYVLQQATATASDALVLFRRLRILPTGDTALPAAVAFPLDFDQRHTVVLVGRARAPRRLGGLELGVVGRWGSGLPYSATTPSGDSLLGLPNSRRLPAHWAVDVLARRAFRTGPVHWSVYVDVRNVTNRRNVLAVRRDTGRPEAGAAQVQRAAEAAYRANPQPIPFESARYRSFADADGDGLLSGPEELMPLFERAARDFLQPLFAFGSPRSVRVGLEVAF